MRSVNEGIAKMKHILIHVVVRILGIALLAIFLESLMVD